MLSISSWRSDRTSPQPPETVKPVVRRAPPVPKAPSAAPVASPPEPEVGGEHRAAVRRPASAVPSISGLSLLPSGAEATLVNISATGLLAECGVPLRMGHLVKVLFEGTFVPQSVEGRVARSCVSSMTSSGVRYFVGVVFKVPIDLESNLPPECLTDGNPAAVAVADPPQPLPIVNRW